MTLEKIIELIESGRQLGVSKIVKVDKTDIAYTYAVEKHNNKYIVYIDEVNLDEMYYDELNDTEQIYVYNSFSEFMDNFIHKYDVKFEDFSVSKGQKFFNLNGCLQKLNLGE